MINKPAGIICRPENYETAIKLLQQAGLIAVPQKLKPCPFCGQSYVERHVDRFGNGHFIKCHNWNCGVSTPVLQMQEEAEEVWNRRKLHEPNNDEAE
jgi:Lar family restriction alleviation protein